MLSAAPGALQEWREMIRATRAPIELYGPEDRYLPGDVDAGLVYRPPRGVLAGCPNLRLIFSLGAGVDHLSSDPELPEVPIVKLMTPAKQALMNEWILYAVLRFHRGFDRFERLQRERRWEHQGPGPLAEERRVTVLGLGDLGAAAAAMLRDHGFRVAGWSRTPKTIEGVRCESGMAGLHALLPETDILVCLLALTPETAGLLDASLFARLPKGAAVVNAGRGQQLVAADLVAALDGGQLRGAMLDVADPEPLPPDDPLWTHPKVAITPHMSAYMPHHKALASLLENWRRLQAGEPLLHRVDRARGY